MVSTTTVSLVLRWRVALNGEPFGRPVNHDTDWERLDRLRNISGLKLAAGVTRLELLRLILGA